MVRRILALAAACVLSAGLVACGTSSGDPGGQAGGPVGSVSSSGGRADPSAPDLVAKRKASHLEACAPGPAKHGGLPDVTLPCLGGGRSASLSTFRGPLVVNFFQGFCEPCREEMPALAAFYKTYGTKVPVIGIDTMDTQPGIALDRAIRRGITFPLYADPAGELQGSPLSVRGVPTTFVLTADGKVEPLQSGGMKSAAQVRRLVEEKLGVTL